MLNIKEQVEEYYDRNSDYFDALGDIFHVRHDIPKSVTRDAIKKRIFGALTREMPGKWIIASRTRFISIIYYYFVMCYFLWCSLFGPRDRNKKKVEILIDYWNVSNGQYYDGIIKKLSNFDVWLWMDSIEKYPKHSGVPVSKIIYKKYRPYSRKAAWSVFKSHCLNFGTYWKLTKFSNVDFIDLALRLCAEIAGHMTTVEGVSSDILISAQDNGYSPYRYYIYRANGIGCIFLIQNGARIPLMVHSSSYIYSDYYIGWSRYRLDRFTQMRCKNKIALGSCKLSEFLNIYDPSKTNKQYDILFIEQIYAISDPKYKVFTSFLKYIVRYSIENPGASIVYCKRPATSTSSSNDEIEQILSGSNIDIPDISRYLSSYELVMKSSVVVSVNSSLRCEAAMLGKMILTCNSTFKPDDYLLEISDACFVVQNDSYNEFSKNINYLLNNQESLKVSAAKKRLRDAFIGDKIYDYPEELASLIKKELRCANHDIKEIDCCM